MMQFRDRTIKFDTPKVMGIVNVTPDSFSDGGKYNSLESALRQSANMVQQGATFIDIGGESTRPGASEVSLQEELDRVIPVIERICSELDTVVSVDTSKPQVMNAAVEAGAALINDVRALSLPNALSTAANLAQQYNVPCCIMHMKGTPTTMQNAPSYKNVIDEITAFFSAKIEQLTSAGFAYKQIMIDPGFGFGKSLDHNYEILKNFGQFTQFDLPVLAGMSRKSMIGQLLERDIHERLPGDIAAHTIAAMFGASIVRVHDVQQVVDAMKVVEKVSRTQQ
ncbi:MAG: dihydropteroate synthase [Glaciecola sp.]